MVHKMSCAHLSKSMKLVHMYTLRLLIKFSYRPMDVFLNLIMQRLHFEDNLKPLKWFKH